MNNEATQIQPYVSWDTCSILEKHAKYLVQIGQAASQDDGWNIASNDPFFLVDQWDCLLNYLTEKLIEVNPDGYWHCDVKNFGWRNISGFKDFKADTAKTFLNRILPETDCTFHIFIEESPSFKEIKIQNYHHDSPCGEWYTVIARSSLTS